MVLARRPALRAVACAGMASWALVRPSAAVASAPIVINEVLYDAVGADTGQEWIELFNAGEAEGDLSNWRIERGGTSFTLAFAFPEGARVAPRSFLLVGEASVSGAAYQGDLVFQNGGSATDGVRLVDGTGAVVDVLLYDEPNTSGLPDEGGSAGTSFAPDAGEGQSLARRADGADTNASGADFAAAQTPTPGASNGSASSSSPTPTASPAAGVNPQGVVVNEALPDPVGTDAEGEFIELFNPTENTVALGGAQLDDGEGGSSPYAIPSGKTIGPKAFLVFPRADTKLALNNEGDTVRLLASDGALVSQLAYPKSPKEGASWARKSDGSAVWTTAATAGTANVFMPINDGTGSTTPPPTVKSGSAATPSVKTPSPTPLKGAVSGATTKKPSGLATVSAPPRAAAASETPPVVAAAAAPAAEFPVADGTGDAAPAETLSPAPSPQPPADAAPPPRQFPVPAVLAWVVAGVVGLFHVLNRRRRPPTGGTDPTASAILRGP